MSGTPKKEPEGSPDPIQMETRQPKIMTVPLPDILDELENSGSQKTTSTKKKTTKKEVAEQISFFGQKSPLLEELEKLDINSLMPLEALNKLYELQKKAREG